MHLPLTKHHGLGNDFLVLLDLSATLDVDGGPGAGRLQPDHRGRGRRPDPGPS